MPVPGIPSSLHAHTAQFLMCRVLSYPLSPVSSLLLQVIPVNSAGSPVGDVPFVRSGLLGFVGPVCNTLCELTLLYSCSRW